MKEFTLFNTLRFLVLLVFLGCSRRFSFATWRRSPSLAQSSLIHAQNDFLDGRFHASFASLAQADNWLITLTNDISVPFALVIGFGRVRLREFDYLEWLGFPERSVHWQYFWRSRVRHHTLLTIKFLTRLLD